MSKSEIDPAERRAKAVKIKSDKVRIQQSEAINEIQNIFAEGGKRISVADLKKIKQIFTEAAPYDTKKPKVVMDKKELHLNGIEAVFNKHNKQLEPDTLNEIRSMYASTKVNFLRPAIGKIRRALPKTREQNIDGVKMQLASKSYSKVDLKNRYLHETATNTIMARDITTGKHLPLLNLTNKKREEY